MPPLRSLLQPPPAAPGQMPPRPQGPLTPGEQLMTLAMGLFGVNEPERQDFTTDEAYHTAQNPYALGSLGSLLGPAILGMAAKLRGEAAPVQQTLRAYHGSPHDFERFDLSKIGTGEGAQAYGHGLYFAENEATAAEYRRVLAQRQQTSLLNVQHGIRQAEKYAAKWQSMLDDPSIPRPQTTRGTPVDNAWLKAEVQDEIEEKARLMKSPLATAPLHGRTYEVNIHASPDELLDWDKPLSQQSPKVQEALKQIKIPRGYMGSNRFDGKSAAQSAAERMGLMPGEYELHQVPNESRWWQVMAPVKANTGEDIYEQVVAAHGGRSAHTEGIASQKLKDAGIKGIQYLDQGSRAAGEGTKNFVIFDDKIIEIAKKYGISLPVAASLYKWQQSQSQQKGVE